MKSKLWILTKVFLKNGNDGLFKKKNKNVPKLISGILIIAILMMCIGIPFGEFIGSSYDTLASINQQGIIISFAMVIICMVIFIFGIFTVLSVFYFSKDIEYLLPMPIYPYEIIGAKFITVLLYEYAMEFIIMAPTVIVYGNKDGAGVLFYVFSLIVFLLLPVIPLVLASIINMVIMRFTNLGKHKDALKIFSGLLGLFLAIGINLFTQKTARNSVNNQDQMLQLMMQGKNSFVNVITTLFPSSKIASIALINSNTAKGLENLLIFVLINIVLIVLFLVLAQILYFKGVLGSSENYSKRKKITGDELEKSIAYSSSLKAYTIKEIKLLVRTPAYLLNCVIMNFLWPIFMLLPLISNPNILKQMGNINSVINGNNKVIAIMVVVSLAIGMFICSTNGIASTAISREGQNLFFNKYIPMSYKKQIMAKVLSGVIVSGTGITLMFILASLIIKPSLYIVFMTLIAALMGVIFGAFTGILIDLNFPKLNWDNEQKAVKQNLNVMFNMLINVVIGGLSVFLIVKFKITLTYAFSFIIIVFGLANMTLFSILSSVGTRLFNKM